MPIEEEFEEIVGRSKELDRPEKDLLMTAFLSEELSKLIMVGGAATSWYARGGYRTLDVAVIVDDGIEELTEGLKQLGFKRNRVWHFAPADYALDVVSRTSKPGRTRTYEIGGYEIEIASPEDVIVNDLAGWKFWNRASDFERAKLVFETEREGLDREYLQERSREEKVEDALAELE